MTFHFHKNRFRTSQTVLYIATALTLSPVAGQHSPAKAGNEVAAKVNDDLVFEVPLLTELKSLADNIPEDSAAYQQMRRQVLQSAIDRRLALAYLKKISQHASDDDIQLGIIRLEKRLALKNQTLNDYLSVKKINRQELKHRIAWQISWSKYSNQFLNDKNYEDFYKQRKRQFDGTQLQVSQILLHIDPKQRNADETLSLAESVLQQILDDELSFVDAAKQYSDSPTGKTGGVVGLIQFDGAMPLEFNQAAFALKPGEISKPVRTTFGYHLIMLNEIKEGMISWQMARPRLRKAMIEYLLTFLTEQGRKISTIEISEDWQ